MTLELLINLDVPDLEAATRFYVEAFGFRVGRRLGAAGTELLGAGAPLYLLPKAEGSAATAGGATRRTYTRHWTPLHLDVVVDDIHATLERALAAGARAEDDVSEHAWGYMVPLADPFGHGVCLVQLKPGGYDAIATG